MENKNNTKKCLTFAIIIVIFHIGICFNKIFFFEAPDLFNNLTPQIWLDIYL